MSVRLLTTLEELAAVAAPWRTLAGGVPMRGPEWLGGWVQHYHEEPGQPLVLSVWRGEQLIGLAPWRLEKSLRSGRAIRWLGDGEVCTDHLTVLTKPGDNQTVAEELAEWLIDEFNEWDLLDLDHTDADDPAVTALFEVLSESGCASQAIQDDACWTIELPDDWEEFLARQSKSHRKQLRRAERRVLESDACVWTPVQSLNDWEQAWPVLIDLHQRRRQSLGEPGCFASERFTAFHRELSRTLLKSDQLRMSWLALDGQPVAAEYHFAGSGAVYAYQGGVDPERLDDEPGRLSNIATLRHAIEESRTTFDFLRGDEPYKAHWRAVERPTMRRTAVAPRQSARFRAQANRAADTVRGALKSGLVRLRQQTNHR